MSDLAFQEVLEQVEEFTPMQKRTLISVLQKQSFLEDLARWRSENNIIDNSLADYIAQCHSDQMPDFAKVANLWE